MPKDNIFDYHQRQEKHKVTAIVAQARVFEAGEYKLEKITMKKPSLYLEIIFPYS